MKKDVEVKYPQSASLFQFCRLVLDHKFGGIRVIDQDVGQILGFDPADCSHWKKGKKNIRSIQAMKSIAEHLGVDEKLITDVAAGDLDEREAFFEYSGYGAFEVDPKLMEAAKKDYYRKFASTWSQDKETELKEMFAPDIAAIDKAVTTIHEKINFKEAPLYIPEVVAAYPTIQFVANEPSEDGDREQISITNKTDGVTEIRYTSGQEMRPFMRFKLARALASHFLPKRQSESPELSKYSDHISELEANLFAAKLLTPAAMVRNEMNNINVSKDIVSQLAETFWVSKIFMNRRLREILQQSPSI